MSQFLSVLFAVVLTLAFGLIAWAPWVPPFSELKHEAAVVQDMDLTSGTPAALFLTSSNLTIRCASTRRGDGCKPDFMRSLREARTPVDLWHDGRKVYQLAVGGQIILPYDRMHQGREFGFAIFVVLLLAWCVRGAMYFGLFRARRAH